MFVWCLCGVCALYVFVVRVGCVLCDYGVVCVCGVCVFGVCESVRCVCVSCGVCGMV